MVEDMKESINMIRSTAGVFTPGLTEEDTKDLGPTANNTEKENTFCQAIVTPIMSELVSGITERELSGLMRMMAKLDLVHLMLNIMLVIQDKMATLPALEITGKVLNQDTKINW